MNSLWSEIQKYPNSIKSNLIRSPLLSSYKNYGCVEEISAEAKPMLDELKALGFTERLSLMHLPSGNITHFLYNPNTTLVSVASEKYNLSTEDAILNTKKLNSKIGLVEYIYIHMSPWGKAPFQEYYFDKELHDLSDYEIFDKLMSEIPLEKRKQIATEDTEHKLFYRIVVPVKHHGINSEQVTEIAFSNNDGSLYHVKTSLFTNGVLVKFNLEYSKIFEPYEVCPDIQLLKSKLYYL